MEYEIRPEHLEELKKAAKSISLVRVMPFETQRQMLEIQNEKDQKTDLLRKYVQNAIRKRKIFTILGCYPSLIKVLRSRGWIEKFYYHNNQMISSNPNLSQEIQDEDSESGDLLDYNFLFDEPLSKEDKENICRWMCQMGMSSLYPIFIWTRRRDHINFNRLRQEQIVNHFPSADFTTKVGLSRCMDRLHLFPDVDCDNFFPRCYKIGLLHEKNSFIENYHLTACISILKWVVDHCSADKKLFQSKKIIPKRAIETAIYHCEIFLNIRGKEPVEKKRIIMITENGWNILLGWYNHVLNGSAVFGDAERYALHCKELLTVFRYYWPQLDMEGMNNLWIVKPGAQSRGVGIRILQTLDEILPADIQLDPFHADIVQKYIERPLLIHKTKFDIRQWFLITDWNPLTIYFYRNCYIRFCSKPFSLQDRSVAAHLCNNAVQQNFMFNRVNKNTKIPPECMWSYDEFKHYLSTEGQPYAWESSIYPGMKNALIITLQSSQIGCNFRKNCFELYGADFMVSEDFHPWLIEINSDPCLAPTTNVTARLCPNVLEDILKVILDRQNNSAADIGGFECIYTQSGPVSNLYGVGVLLREEGVRIPNPCLDPTDESLEKRKLKKRPLSPRKRKRIDFKTNKQENSSVSSS